jgi:hypothetical protein
MAASDTDVMNQIRELSCCLRLLIDSIASYRKKIFENGSMLTLAWLSRQPPIKDGGMTYCDCEYCKSPTETTSSLPRLRVAYRA